MPAISISTRERDEAHAERGRVYFPHRLAVMGDADAFAMSLSAVSLGAVSVGRLGYSGEVCVETAELQTAYEVNVPLDTPSTTRSGTCSRPRRPCRGRRRRGRPWS